MVFGSANTVLCACCPGWGTTPSLLQIPPRCYFHPRYHTTSTNFALPSLPRRSLQADLSEAIIRLCPHAYVRTIVHRTQTHTHVRCSSVRRQASATGRPCMALYPPPTMLTFVGPLLNAFSSPANKTPDLGTYAQTETVYAYLSMRTCAENASRPL